MAASRGWWELAVEKWLEKFLADYDCAYFPWRCGAIQRFLLLKWIFHHNAGTITVAGVIRSSKT